jgi:hypothetical protein
MSCSVEIDDSVDSVTEIDVAGGCGVVGWGGKGPSLPAQVKGVSFLWECEHRDGLI